MAAVDTSMASSVGSSVVVGDEEASGDRGALGDPVGRRSQTRVTGPCSRHRIRLGARCGSSRLVSTRSRRSSSGPCADDVVLPDSRRAHEIWTLLLRFFINLRKMKTCGIYSRRGTRHNISRVQINHILIKYICIPKISRRIFEDIGEKIKFCV